MSENKHPLLTLVTCAYNAEDTLARCLQSICEQTATGLRVLVVDDGSTDGTAVLAQTFVSEHPEIVEARRVSHRGLGAARNFGLALVDTPYTGFLDADDWLPSDFAERLTSCLQARGDVDMIFILPTCCDERDGTMSPWYDKDVIENVMARKRQPFTIADAPELFGMQTSACAKLYRTAFLNEIGYAFPESALWEDIVPHCLAVSHAKACIALPETGFVYRRHRREQITMTRTSKVLDMPVQLNSAYLLLSTGEWSDHHWACFLKRVVDYSRWMFGLSMPEAVPNLAVGLHALYGRISPARWRCFNSIATRNERLWTRILRSSLYKPFASAYYVRRQRM